MFGKVRLVSVAIQEDGDAPGILTGISHTAVIIAPTIIHTLSFVNQDLAQC